MSEKCGENKGGNSGLHAKNQREISSNKVRRLLWPLGEGKCGKGGKWYKGRGKCIIKSKIGFPDLISSNRVGRLLWSLGGRKCGKRGGELYKEKGKCNIEFRIEFTVPK